jgi:hypothetical protein
MKLVPALDDSLVRVLEPVPHSLVVVVLLVLIFSGQKLFNKDKQLEIYSGCFHLKLEISFA